MRPTSRGVRPIAKTGATFIAVAISPQPYCRPAHPELLGYLTHSGVLFQCGQRHLFANIHNRFLLERHRTSSASTFNDVETINLELSAKHQPGTYQGSFTRDSKVRTPGKGPVQGTNDSDNGRKPVSKSAVSGDRYPSL